MRKNYCKDCPTCKWYAHFFDEVNGVWTGEHWCTFPLPQLRTDGTCKNKKEIE